MPQIAEALAAKPKPRKKRYREGPLLNQGTKPHCVAFSGKGFLTGAPIMSSDENINTTELYGECQRNDEWPGENYDGTSVRALMKVLAARGEISSYVWGQTIDELIEWILGGFGTAIVGTEWFERMDEVDSKGFVQLPGTMATPIGGHAYRIVWWDRKLDAGLIRNSWGPLWGILKRNGERTGEAWIRRVDLDRLLKAWGEIAGPTQIKIRPTVLS